MRTFLTCFGAAITLSGLLFVNSAEGQASGGAMGPEVLHIPQLERQAEQGILRPVPISADLPQDIALLARRVLVHYRLWGDPDWTTLELLRNGSRYEGAVPCLEISTVTGDLKYYIRVHDVEGRVSATGASRADPYRVVIKHDDQLAEGEPITASCPDPADCPAGLLGCPSERVIQIACKTDVDCEGGSTCSWRGFCEKIDRKKSWLSLGISQDFGVVATTGACHVYQQENHGYSCFRADGEQYIGNAVLTNEALGAGLGPTRVLVGFERLVHYDTTLGLRAGFALFGQGPTPREGTEFVPFSASLRVAHWFGDDPFARQGLRSFVFLTGGYSMVDIVTTTHVREDPNLAPYQGGNDLEQTLKVWKRAGDGFAGFGGGVSFGFSATRAAYAELALMSVFPFSALVISPQLGVAMGF